MLSILHPEIAFRDCDHCTQYVYDEETGEPIKRRGKLVERPPKTHPPCRYKNPETGRFDNCHKGTPENNKELTEQNFRAYEFYLECQAVNSFPEDPIVRRNAALIARAEKFAFATLYGDK